MPRTGHSWMKRPKAQCDALDVENFLYFEKRAMLLVVTSTNSVLEPPDIA